MKIMRPEASRIDYRCSKCKAEGVKLWRQYQTFLDHIDLLCLGCALADQKETVWDWMQKGTLRTPTDQVGWLVPAVPTVEMDTFWGYTSIPIDRIQWWQALPV